MTKKLVLVYLVSRLSSSYFHSSTYYYNGVFLEPNRESRWSRDLKKGRRMPRTTTVLVVRIDLAFPSQFPFGLCPGMFT